MVAAAEFAPDLGVAARGQHLGQIHRHLPRADDGAGATLGGHFGAVDAVELADGALDLVDGDAFAVGGEDVGELFLGEGERDRLAGELGIGDELI